MKHAKRPKIKDVAKLAGVSESAVSAVMNNRVGKGIRVSEATQMKIHDAIRQLGYVANPAARSLAGGQSNIIAVFTFESIFPMDHRNFYYPFLIGIEAEAARQGYDLLMITSNDGDRRTIYKNGINRLALADGAILLGFENKDDLHQLLDDEFPFVFIGRRELERPLSFVMADYVSASAEIVRYITQQGHQKLLYLQSTRDHEPSWDRLEGLFVGMEESGFQRNDLLIWRGDAEDLSEGLVESYLARGVTAIVVEDDLFGKRIQELGYQCPQDFSLAVLGDPLSFVDNDHPWTTFKNPRRELGSEAVRLLAQLLGASDSEESGPYQTIMPCQFVQGHTVAPPN